MNKFWPKNSPGFHLYPHQVITTREKGDIPGYTPAPREGIYRPMLLSVAQFGNTMRVRGYEADVNAYIAGNLPKEKIFQRFEAPIFGAFGEKL